MSLTGISSLEKTLKHVEEVYWKGIRQSYRKYFHREHIIGTCGLKCRLYNVIGFYVSHFFGFQSLLNQVKEGLG